MKELQLYKFIRDNDLEIDWRGEELVLWIDFCCLSEFAEMIKHYLLDGGADVNLRDGCIALDIVPLCDYFGIDPENILEKGE